MNKIPFVSPSNNEAGVALLPELVAIFDFDVEKYTIDKTNCFLIKKISDPLNNRIDPIPVKITYKRIGKTDTSEYTSPNFGTEVSPFEVCRTRISIIPEQYLEALSEYSVVLGTDVSAISIFDAQPLSSNTSPVILTKGLFSGAEPQTYTIKVIQTGDQTSATFSWKNSSDNTEKISKARSRFIELEKGVYVKFIDGLYKVGDSYTIKVTPPQKTNETFAWNFITAGSDFKEPTDKQSNITVGLPIAGGQVSSSGSFSIISQSPYDGESMVSVSPDGCQIDILFNKKIDPTSVTKENIKIIAQSLSKLEQGKLDCTFEIVDNRLIIKLI